MICCGCQDSSCIASVLSSWQAPLMSQYAPVWLTYDALLLYLVWPCHGEWLVLLLDAPPLRLELLHLLLDTTPSFTHHAASIVPMHTHPFCFRLRFCSCPLCVQVHHIRIVYVYLGARTWTATRWERAAKPQCLHYAYAPIRFFPANAWTQHLQWNL
jgi:hypothetical protein